jgi:hypothetical protein
MSDVKLAGRVLRERAPKAVCVKLRGAWAAFASMSECVEGSRAGCCRKGRSVDY